MIGALSMRFSALLSILCVSFISNLVGVYVSAPYVRIGMIHVCTSLHIADISIVLNFRVSRWVEYGLEGCFYFSFGLLEVVC